MRFIALIPARSGSKSVKNKNLQIIGKFNLLERALISAINCKSLDQIWISSDDEVTLSYAEKYNVLSHKRTYSKANDYATANDVVQSFFEHLEELKYDLESTSLVYLQPTSPFRNSNHIQSAITEFLKNSCTPLVSIVKNSQHPQKSFLIDEVNNKLIEPDWAISPTSNRQNLTTYFYPNGAIYIFRVSDFLTFNIIPVVGSIGFKMSKLASLDIDDECDLLIARSVQTIEGF
jgi:CMP-N-acetylneuraminic acid synthetase